MKNLKRILSLALAGTMLVGMMMVGASAADFTDQDSIDHKTAVETLVALGVLHGNTDGTFNPKGELTRAEMATVIATIYNKGKTPNYGTKATPTFADTKGHWAEAIIEYCYSFKLVAGESATRFNPEGKLTATEAARMILNTMGYTVENPTNWKIETEVQARDEDVNLYDGLDDEITDPSNARITRDQMAQMAYKALNAKMAGDATYETTEEGKTGTTVVNQWQINLVAQPANTQTGWVDTLTEDADKEAAWKKLDAKAFDSKSAAKAAIEKVISVDNGTNGAEEGTNFTLDSILTSKDVMGDVTVTKAETLGHKFLSMDTVTITRIEKVEKVDDGYKVNDTYTVAEDPSDLMGQKATAIVKKNTAGDITKTYGFTAVGTVAYEGTVGEYARTYTGMTNSSTKTAIGEAKIFDFNDFDENEARTIDNDITSVDAQCALKLVNNGKTDGYVAVVTPVSVAKVTSVTSKKIGITPGSALVIADEDAENVNGIAYDGIAKGDMVLVIAGENTVSGKTELTKAEVKSGVAATAYRSLVNPAADQVRVNGEWLNVLKAADFNELKKMTKDTTYDLVMVNGYVASQTVVTSATAVKDLLILTEVAEKVSTSVSKYVEARAYFVKDGTTAIIKLSGKDVTDGTITTTYPEHTLHAYTEKDGVYTLSTPVVDDIGYDKAVDATAGVAETDNKVGGTLIAENAQVIVLMKDNKVQVVDGKAARGWKLDADWGADSANVAYANNVNGVDYVQFLYLVNTSAEKLPGAKTEGKDYGYIVSDPYTTSAGVVYTIWNGEENVEVTDKDGAAGLKKGDIISYETGDGVIKSTKLTGDAKTKNAAVMGWNTADEVINLILTGTNTIVSKVMDEDTVKIFINAETKAGEPEGDLVVATEDEDAPGTYYSNVTVVEGDEDHVDLLIVDVNNDISGGTAEEGDADDRVNLAIDALTSDNWTFKVMDGETEINGATNAVKKGSVITVTATVTSDGATAGLGFELKNDSDAFAPAVKVANKADDETWYAVADDDHEITVKTVTFKVTEAVNLKAVNNDPA